VGLGVSRPGGTISRSAVSSSPQVYTSSTTVGAPAWASWARVPRRSLLDHLLGVPLRLPLASFAAQAGFLVKGAPGEQHALAPSPRFRV
jgi:hypothetical protein